jgi:hypothetical protein
MSSRDRISNFPPSEERLHRLELERTMHPRARALLIALEEWLPPRIAWERAMTIAGPLLLLEGTDVARTRPELVLPEVAIGEGLRDLVAMKGLPASPERIADAVRAWSSARVSQTLAKAESAKR